MANHSITRHVVREFMQLHILSHAAEDPIYGALITEELIHHGYHLSRGTLYPMLHLLEKLGYLQSHTDWLAGRRRKYYRTTLAGRTILAEARQQLQDMAGKILDHDKADRSPPKRRRLLSRSPKVTPNGRRAP